MRRQQAVRHNPPLWSWSRWRRHRAESRQRAPCTTHPPARASIAATAAADLHWSRASPRRWRRCSYVCARRNALGWLTNAARSLSVWSSTWSASAIVASRPRIAMCIRSTARISVAANARTQMHATSAWSSRSTSTGTMRTAPAPAATIRAAPLAPSSTRRSASAPMWVAIESSPIQFSAPDLVSVSVSVYDVLNSFDLVYCSCPPGSGCGSVASACWLWLSL